MKLTNRQKSSLFSFLLIIAILGFRFYQNWATGSDIDDINMAPTKQLIYTKHAKCRMDCREISRQEVEFIRKEGKINNYKSDPKDRPCPTIAKEGRTSDGQMVRIVFAECNRETKVVTAIDLENEYDCYCK